MAPHPSIGTVLDDPVHVGWQIAFPGKGTLTGGQVRETADQIAFSLVQAGVVPGEVVGVLTSSSPVAPVSFFGVWRAGAAVSMLASRPATSPAVIAKSLAGVADAARMRFLLAERSLEPVALELRKLRPGLIVLDPAQLRAGRCTLPQVASSDLAVVQFTSGSTSRPKGVILTHAAVLAFIAQGNERLHTTADDTFVQWIPFFHDMGLFTFLMALFAGGSAHVFSPFEFYVRPGAVLKHIADAGCTVMFSPNFGYDRLLESRPQDLDLSRWRVAGNGAELVQAQTVSRFAELTRPGVMFPCYGMAECVAGITTTEPGVPPTIVHIDRSVFANTGRISFVPPGDPAARAMVSVGKPFSGLRLRIVDSEIQVSGDSVMSGYLNDPEATAAAFDGPWLRTGDLGFEHNGELFIAGRRKEMIIVNGQNFYPEDAEAIVRVLPGVYRGRCVAFADTAQERVVVAVEAAGEAEELQERALAAVRSGLGLQEAEIRVVPRKWLPQTTSGKWQRGLARELLYGTTGHGGREKEGKL